MSESRFFEDVRTGETFSLGPYEMTEERIVDFARAFDPQPMHLDPTAGRASPLGGLAASGWHTASVLMRLVYDSWLCHCRSLGSPGIEGTAWPRAVMVGESILGEGRLLSKRVSRTRPDTGLVQVGIAMRDTRHGTEVLRATWWLMLERRSTEVPADSATPRRRPSIDSADPPRRSEAMAPTLRMLHLGGIEPETSIYLGEASASEDDMIAFARAFDPQPFHLGRKAGEPGLLGGFAASGWHTCALWMRTNVRARQVLLTELSETKRRKLEHSAAIGLGFENLSWNRPVRPDNRLHAFITPLDSRKSRSRPGWGVARWRAEMTDNNGDRVLCFYPSLLMREP